MLGSLGSHSSESPAEQRAAWKTLSVNLINVMSPCISVSAWVSSCSSSEFVFQCQPTPVGLGSPGRLSLTAPAPWFRRSPSDRLRARRAEPSCRQLEAGAVLSHCDRSCSLAQPAAREGGEALLGFPEEADSSQKEKQVQERCQCFIMVFSFN